MSKKVSMKKFNSLTRDVATLHQGSIKLANASAKAVYTKSRQSDIKILDGVIGAIVDIGEIEGIKKKKVKKIIKNNFTPAAKSVSKKTKKAVNKGLNQAAEAVSLSDKQIKSLNIKKPLSKIENAVDKSISKITDMNFSGDSPKINSKKSNKKKKKAEKEVAKQTKTTAEFITKGMKEISEMARKNGGYTDDSSLNIITSQQSSSNKKKKKKNKDVYTTEMLDGMTFAN